MKHIKKLFLFILALIMTLIFVACGKEYVSSNTFPNVENADIPDALEKAVGTLGNTCFTSGISDNEDYQSFLMATFNDTTEADYMELMEHYQSTSTGKDENGFLLFDWGWIQVVPDDGSISISAYIK